MLAVVVLFSCLPRRSVAKAGFFVFLFSCFLVLFSNASYAAETGLTPPQLQIDIPTLNMSEWTSQNAGNWLGLYLAAWYKYAVGVVGIVAAVVMMFGGVVWLTAGGESGRVTEAKEWIKASLTGLIIALLSYTILYVINPDLVSFRSLDITKISQTTTPTGANLTRSGAPIPDLSGLGSFTEITKAYEGLRLERYTDSTGNPTIGYGHRIKTGESYTNITQQQAQTLFTQDYAQARQDIQTFAATQNVNFNNLSSARQGVLIDMTFNMGIGSVSQSSGVAGFVKMWDALRDQNYNQAAAEIIDSNYSGQVGRRAETNAQIMRTNALP